MVIEVWSDFVCPFCYINQKRLYDALEKFDLIDKAKIIYRSYQLDTTKNRDKSITAVESLAQNYNMPMGKAARVMEKTAMKVEDAGLVYNYDKIIGANTHNAHKLTYYANEFRRTKLFTDSIFKAHFEKGQDIEDRNTLLSIAIDSGLDKDIVLNILDSDKYEDNIKKDIEDAKRLRIEVVPTIIIDEKHRIEGVLEEEDYDNLLKSVMV